jgi:hypothetical protein
MLRAGTLALAVVALTAPGFAQEAQKPQPEPQMKQQQRGTTGAGDSRQLPGTIDSGGAHMQGTQQGAQPGTTGATPGGPSGAPANPCTPALKAQNRC